MDQFKESVEKVIRKTDAELNKWETFKEDYEKLKSRLLTLPNTLTQDVMVPFGNKAHISGQLVHTNEILVLLGDNWFVERSAKQAADIVSRRLKDVEETLTGLRQQKKLLADRLSVTSEIFDKHKSGEYVDIQEDFDEEREKEWRKRHAQRVKEERRKMKESEEGQGDADLWDRLDRLEVTEREEREMADKDASGDMKSLPYSKLTRDSDVKVNVKRVGWVDDDDEGDGNDDVCIHFHHTTTPDDQMNETRRSSRESRETITSPADIYARFYTPTSILKKPLPDTDSSFSTGQAECRDTVILPQACSDQVSERRELGVTTAKSGYETRTDISNESSDTQTKKMSRFKRERTKDKL